tara:strand:+ start:2068 stop:2271 length:204 start_codon:yes stop_codon:yes gene_type:complete
MSEKLPSTLEIDSTLLKEVQKIAEEQLGFKPDEGQTINYILKIATNRWKSWAHYYKESQKKENNNGF